MWIADPQQLPQFIKLKSFQFTILCPQADLDCSVVNVRTNTHWYIHTLNSMYKYIHACNICTNTSSTYFTSDKYVLNAYVGLGTKYVQNTDQNTHNMYKSGSKPFTQTGAVLGQYFNFPYLYVLVCINVHYVQIRTKYWHIRTLRTNMDQILNPFE